MNLKGSLLLQVERIMTLEVSHFFNYAFLLIILPLLELIKNKWSVRHAFLNNKEKSIYKTLYHHIWNGGVHLA